jgi:hypothetical protein
MTIEIEYPEEIEIVSIDVSYDFGIAKINSVKRLTDNKTFTVGDDTNFGIITKFYTEGDIMYFDSYPFKRVPIKGLQQKQKEVLFTTEDGWDIFKEDGNKCTVVFDDYNYNAREQQDQTLDEIKFYGRCNLKIFSNYDNAINYIVENKKHLSYNDVIHLSVDTSRLTSFKRFVRESILNLP